MATAGCVRGRAGQHAVRGLVSRPGLRTIDVRLRRPVHCAAHSGAAGQLCCHVVVLRPCAVRLPLPQSHPYAGAYFCNELTPHAQLTK